MIKRILCKDLYEEIERLERSVIELEEQIIELKTQLNMKTEEATSLYIENQSLRHKLEVRERTYEKMVELLKAIKFPIILLSDEDLEE